MSPAELPTGIEGFFSSHKPHFHFERELPYPKAKGARFISLSLFSLSAPPSPSTELYHRRREAL
jgi:hypothetical protein